MLQNIRAEASEILERTWSEICSLAEQGQLQDWLDDDTLIESIRGAINSTAKSFRYVLPTQVIAKLADSSLDCRCLQAARGGSGAFDARTIAHRVVVPFDQANDRVLGGSPEPYVNNPLRVPEVSASYRSAQRNPTDWDYLCHVLSAVEQRQNEEFTSLVLKQVLTEVYRRLSQIRVVYPTP